MINKYQGSLITASPPTVTISAAPGIWSLEEAAKYKQANTWPGPVPTGEDSYTTPGTYSWVAPSNVNTVAVVCVGGGGGGHSLGTSTDGGDSSFTASFGTATAGGGKRSIASGAGVAGAPSGTYDGGYSGGTGGTSSGGSFQAGAGGAGGYTANGGNGTGGTTSATPAGYFGAGGGGVGLFGGTSGGGGGLIGVGGTGGSGGTDGEDGAYPNIGGDGGSYGGGAGGAIPSTYGGGGQSGAGGGGALVYKNNISVTPGSSYTVVVGVAGISNTGTPQTVAGTGAVRIIWGLSRTFPSNAA